MALGFFCQCKEVPSKSPEYNWEPLHILAIEEALLVIEGKPPQDMCLEKAIRDNTYRSTCELVSEAYTYCGM